MGRLRRGVTAVTVFFLTTAALGGGDAHAGFMFVSGSLDASASASDTSGTNTVTAPTKVLTSASGGSVSASATSPGGGGSGQTSGSGSTSFSMSEWTNAQQQPPFPALNIGGMTANSKLFGSTGPSGGGSASGSVTFTESRLEGFVSSSLYAGFYTQASVTIKNSANQTIASFFASGNETDAKSVQLPADTYTISWNLFSIFRAGTSGGSSMQFQLVPEPASLFLMTLPAMLTLRRTRRARACG